MSPPPRMHEIGCCFNQKKMVKKCRYDIRKLVMRPETSSRYQMPPDFNMEHSPAGFPSAKSTTTQAQVGAAAAAADELEELAEDLSAATSNAVASVVLDDASQVGTEKQRKAQQSMMQKPCQLELMNLLACWRQSTTDNPACQAFLVALQNCAKDIKVSRSFCKGRAALNIVLSL